MTDKTDLTRKQRRTEARAERERMIREQQETARRRKRLLGLGGAVGGAVVVVVILIVVSVAGSGGGHKGLVHGKAATPTENAVTAELKGIPQSGSYLGSAKAPVTIQYFGDLECPICQQFTLSTLPSLIADQVRKGKVRIWYRSLETATRDPSTFSTQQVAALAAGQQNKLWDYIELFYNEQGVEDSGYVTESYLDGIAEQVKGLALPTWESARNQPALAKQVQTDEDAANSDQFNSTPSLIITGPKGSQNSVGLITYSALVGLVNDVS